MAEGDDEALVKSVVADVVGGGEGGGLGRRVLRNPRLLPGAAAGQQGQADWRPYTRCRNLPANSGQFGADVVGRV